MPYKLRNPYRHKFKKAKYKTINWPEYDKALKARGSLNLWISEDVIAAWTPQNEGARNRGGQFQYTDTAILSGLSIRSFFKMALRQLEGFIESLFKLMNIVLAVPDHTLFSRRGAKLKVPETSRHYDPNETVSTVIVDSTGLKVFGEKEWMNHKHKGTVRRKVWRKFHIVIDEKGEILASTMTTLHESDDSQLEPLLDQIGVPVDEIIADGGYSINEAERLTQGKWPNHETKLIIPPEKNGVVGNQNNPSARDEHLIFIKDKGKHRWQKETGYNKRNRVENTFYRYKMILGNTLRSRKFENQEIETQIGCMILNKFKNLGMPKSVRVK